MRRNRIFIMLLVIVTVLAMATTALAGRPDKPDKPDDHPNELPDGHDMWTCAARVDNGAIWLPGEWVDDNPDTPEVEDYYLSDTTVGVDVPLCIDMFNHKDVVDWTVSWVGEPGRKDPKGLMFIFEEVLPGSHYAQREVLPTCVDDDEGVRRCNGSVAMTLIFDPDGVFGDEDGDVKHLVFLAMGRQGDKWESLEFTVTPQPQPTD